MTAEAMTILGMMGGAIAALFSFIIWLFKDTVTQLRDRIKVLETREGETHKADMVSLVAIAKHAEIAATGIERLADGLRDIRVLLLGRSPGGD